MMNPPWLRRLLTRALVALLIMAVQSLLPTLAQASPPDPSWIPGIYDDADDDHIVVLLSSSTGSVTRAALNDLRPRPPMVGTLGSSRESAAETLRASAVHPRAPPAL